MGLYLVVFNFFIGGVEASFVGLCCSCFVFVVCWFECVCGLVVVVALVGACGSSFGVVWVFCALADCSFFFCVCFRVLCWCCAVVVVGVGVWVGMLRLAVGWL